MEIQVLLENYLKNSQQYLQLHQKLIHQSAQCKQKINVIPNISDEQKQRRFSHCDKRINHFNGYLELYKKQFITKGDEICSNQFQEIDFHRLQENKKLNKKQYQQLLSKEIDNLLKAQTQCVKFYSKGHTVFQQNVKDKLKSLVNGLDFSQL